MSDLFLFTFCALFNGYCSTVFPANQAIDAVLKAFVRAQNLAAVDTIIKQVQA